MLHPALDRALVTARIEDLHRAAADRRAIQLARGVARSPHLATRSPQAAPAPGGIRFFMTHGRLSRPTP
jgi:hypothetical protein